MTTASAPHPSSSSATAADQHHRQHRNQQQQHHTYHPASASASATSSPPIELTRLRRLPPSSLRLPPLPPPLLGSPGPGLGIGHTTAPRRLFSFTTEEHAPPFPSPVGAYEHHDDPHDPHHDHEHDPAAAFHLALAALRPPWRRALFALLEHPTSSRAAFVLQMTSTALIVFSACVTVLETVPAVHSISGGVWFGVETSVVALFTVEYVARCVAWSYSWASLFHWVFSFYGVIDLLSVLPYYIELLLQQDTSVYFRFSILRMFRLLRVFRPFRYNHTILLTMEVMYLSVRRSQHALLAIGFFVFMILTVFSTLLYFAERGTWDELLGTFVNVDGDPTQFSSIPAAAWFVLVTITTVGYGEITPRSFLGRLITLPILVFGLLLITLPSFVLGREFSVVWEGMTRGRKIEAELEASRGASTENVAGGTAANGRAGPGSPGDEEEGEDTPLTRRRPEEDAEATPELGAGAWRQQTSPRDALPAPSARPARDPLYSPVYSAMPSDMRLPEPYSAAAGDYGFPRLRHEGNGVSGSSSATPSPGPGPESARPRQHARGHTPPYDPAAPNQISQSQSRSRLSRARDLTNLKLAQNQTELSRQIEELAGAVEAQGRLLARMMDQLGAMRQGGGGAESGLVHADVGTGMGAGKEKES